MAWLMIHPEAVLAVQPDEVLKRLEAFRAAKAKLKTQWGQIPWKLLVDAACKTVATDVQ